MTPPLIWHALKNPKALLKQLFCSHKPNRTHFWIGMKGGVFRQCCVCEKFILIRDSRQILPRQD